MRVAVQLLGFGEEAVNNFEAVVNRCSSLGISGFELSHNLASIGVNRIRNALQASRTTIVGYHIGFPQIANDESLSKTIEFAKGIGTNRIICSGRSPGAPPFANDETLEILARVANNLGNSGLELLYHGLDWAFKPDNAQGNSRSSLIHRIFDEANNVWLALDLFWLRASDCAFSTTLKELAPKTKLVHLKDGLFCATEGERRDHKFRPLGKGQLELESALKIFLNSVTCPLFVIEQDEVSGNSAHDDLVESLEYLNKVIETHKKGANV